MRQVGRKRQRTRRNGSIVVHVAVVEDLAPRRYEINEKDSDRLITAVIGIFVDACHRKNIDEVAVRAMTTKFRDAGRRSAPWRPASSRVPGRPQDGLDGNRINRWLMEPDHKYYATQSVATLVEIKYYLQALSMADAPQTEATAVLNLFHPWLVEQPVTPGTYFDPVQLDPISFTDFVNDRRLVQSGHLRPLDRDGKHEPSNTFLMLARSNQLQGNQTVAELLALMARIVAKHRDRERTGDLLESHIQENV